MNDFDNQSGPGWIKVFSQHGKAHSGQNTFVTCVFANVHGLWSFVTNILWQSTALIQHCWKDCNSHRWKGRWGFVLNHDWNKIGYWSKISFKGQQRSWRAYHRFIALDRSIDTRKKDFLTWCVCAVVGVAPWGMDFSTLGNEAAAAKTANLTINWVAGGKCAIRRTAVQKIWQLTGHRLRNDPGMAFTSVERPPSPLHPLSDRPLSVQGSWQPRWRDEEH